MKLGQTAVSEEVFKTETLKALLVKGEKVLLAQLVWA